MKCLIAASRIAVADPENYEARSNIMWCATWALNTLVACGKTTDWEVHMLGQAVGANTDATHGMTLSAVALPYYRLIMPYGLSKFARFATNVWGIAPEGKTEEELAAAGLDAMEAWMREIGCVMGIASRRVGPRSMLPIGSMVWGCSQLLCNDACRVKDRCKARQALRRIYRA